MRTALLALTLLALTAMAQWALDPSALGYRGWTIGVGGSPLMSLSATVQLLPTPHWQEWILGNWTTAFAVGRGCAVQAGPLRYGIYVNRTAYVETPAITLGQNFTVVAVVKPRYLASDYGWVWLWRKDGPYWFGEMSATYEGSYGGGSTFNIFFRTTDASGSGRVAVYGASRGFVVLVYVGMYVTSQNTYYMYIYAGGVLVSQTSFPGQRGVVGSSAFRLGSGGNGTDQQLWYAAFAVYSRALSQQEVAALRPEALPGNGLVMYYYAYPQFVRDVDGDRVLEWLDLSGNNRHAKLRGAVPQWFVEPVVLSTQQCGKAALSAQWNSFAATYAVNGTQRSVFEPGRIYFDGQSAYATVNLVVYGWQGITVEQYVYISSTQRSAGYNKFTCFGFWSTGPSMCGSTYPYLVSTSASYYFSTASGSTYKKYEVVFQTDRWQHIVMTYNSTTRVLRFYINGTLAAEYTIPSGETTILEAPATHTFTNRLALGANINGGERTQMAYSYVRIYSRALSEHEIRQNYASPNSPVANGLMLWMSWDSYQTTSWGAIWTDKINRGRVVNMYGTAFPYPVTSWKVGAYLQHGYPAASPVVVIDFSFNNVTWTSGSSRGGAVQLAPVDGAYIDAAAYSGSGWAVNRYVAPNSAMGFDAVWTPSDDYRGWITLWRVGATALNITQIGGHGVTLNATSNRAYAGAVAAVLGGGLYLNGTRRVSLPSGSAQTSFALLPSARGGLRALVRYAWIDAGVRYGANSSSTYDGYGGNTYAPSQSPSSWAYYVDFRWWPPVATWGILQAPPITAVRQRLPNQVLAPVVVSGSPRVSASLWGPFGEICLVKEASAPQNNATFGVRHVWLGATAPTCVLPATYATSGSVQSALFNSTVPIRLYFSAPPIQHPYVANSVPDARFCSPNVTHFSTPYLPLKAPGSTVVTDQWACAPSDYFVGGYVAQSAPGWALIAPVMRVFKLNTTSVVYFGSGAAVLARGDAVPALSVRSADGRTWNIYTSGAGAVASAESLQTPPSVSKTGGAVSAVFGVPRSPTTLVSQWWADGVKYYISAAGLADAPVTYISSFTGSPVAVPAELNAPGGYTYYVGIVDNGTYVWAVPLTGPTYFSAYVPAPGYYAVRLYRGEDKVWEKKLYLSPDTKLAIGPVDMPVFTPVNPVSLYTPAAPKPPVFVPTVTMEMPPYAVGILMLGVFAAAYVTMREVSLASLITGAVVAVLGVLINAPIYGVAGVFLLAFGLWNKARRQGSS